MVKMEKKAAYAMVQQRCRRMVVMDQGKVVPFASRPFAGFFLEK